MPLPDLSAFCIRNNLTSRGCVTFPGGMEVCSIFAGTKIPDPSEHAAALLAQVNAGLAPLGPIFDVVDACVSLGECVRGVERALSSTPPDPREISKCAPQLARALAKLAKIVPQLSIPVLVGGLLDLLIVYLTGVRGQILALVRKLLRIAAAEARAHALPSMQLQTVLDCAKADVDAHIANLNAQAKPLGRLVQTVNVFLNLAGQDPIPNPVSFADDAQAAIAPLDGAIAQVRAVRLLFP